MRGCTGTHNLQACTALPAPPQQITKDRHMAVFGFEKEYPRRLSTYRLELLYKINRGGIFYI